MPNTCYLTHWSVSLKWRMMANLHHQTTERHVTDKNTEYCEMGVIPWPLRSIVLKTGIGNADLETYWRNITQSLGWPDIVINWTTANYHLSPKWSTMICVELPINVWYTRLSSVQNVFPSPYSERRSIECLLVTQQPANFRRSFCNPRYFWIGEKAHNKDIWHLNFWIWSAKEPHMRSSQVRCGKPLTAGNRPSTH